MCLVISVVPPLCAVLQNQLEKLENCFVVLAAQKCCFLKSWLALHVKLFALEKITCLVIIKKAFPMYVLQAIFVLLNIPLQQA